MRIFLVLLFGIMVSACSIGAYVKLPEGTQLVMKRGSEKGYSEGLILRSPLSWSSAGGVPYELVKDGETVQTGRLGTKFRVGAIFWPPVAIAYWPMGFALKCYDLTGDQPVQCSTEDYRALKRKR